MNFLIVYSHYEPKSFNGALLEIANRTLLNLNHNIIISDLYGLSFNPISSRKDFTHLYNSDFFKYENEQLNASKKNLYADYIKKEHEKINSSQYIIFIFPLWWNSSPAILRGWFDKVLSNGFAYTNEKNYASGLLKNKIAQIVVTTGAPKSYFIESNKLGKIENVLSGITYGIFNFCGMKVLPTFPCFAVNSISHSERQEYLTSFENYLKNITFSTNYLY